jgi:hypothetical protein
MLIKKITTAALLITCGIAIASENVCTSVPGKMICGSGEVSYVSGNGIVQMNDTSVNGLTSVNGALTAVNSSLMGLDVNGTASLTQCLVKGETSIKGVLKSVATKFDNSLDLYTGKSTFDKSQIKGNIIIKRTSDQNQVIYLENSSEILGDIIFDSGSGEIIMSGDSKIEGNVIGGTITHKK